MRKNSHCSAFERLLTAVSRKRHQVSWALCYIFSEASALGEEVLRSQFGQADSWSWSRFFREAWELPRSVASGTCCTLACSTELPGCAQAVHRLTATLAEAEGQIR